MKELREILDQLKFGVEPEKLEADLLALIRARERAVREKAWRLIEPYRADLAHAIFEMKLPSESEESRCSGRYPVPPTSPPRDEPFEVTYRCGKQAGHSSGHGAE